MAQTGGAEVVAHLVRQAADVADREPGQQPGRSPPAAPRRRRAGRRATRPRPSATTARRPASRGAPRTRRTATVRSARVAGASKPSAPTSCPGSSADQPAAGAISSTRPPPVHRRPPVSAARSVAGTRTCAAPGRPAASPERRACGSSRTTTVRVAAAPRSAAACSGCMCSATRVRRDDQACRQRSACRRDDHCGGRAGTTAAAQRGDQRAAGETSRDSTPGRTGVQAEQDDHPRRQGGRHQPQVGQA